MRSRLMENLESIILRVQKLGWKRKNNLVKKREVELVYGGEGGIRTRVGDRSPHPISSRRRYDRFGTSPVLVKISGRLYAVDSLVSRSV